MKFKGLIALLAVVLLTVTGVFAQDDDTIIDIDLINDDPMTYVGETVTIQDELVEAITPQIFVMEREALLESDRILVVNNSNTIDGFDLRELADNDVEVQVTGTIQEFVLGDVYEQYTTDLDLDLFQDTFEDYDGEIVVIADNVIIIDDLDMDEIEPLELGDILDDPALMVDQTVTIEEQFVEYLGANVYVIEDKDFFSPEQIVVITTGENLINGLDPEVLADEDPEVSVTGTVRAFDMQGLEDEFGIELDNDFFEDYEDAVIVAESIILNEMLDDETVEESEDD